MTPELLSIIVLVVLLLLTLAVSCVQSELIKALKAYILILCDKIVRLEEEVQRAEKRGYEFRAEQYKKWGDYPTYEQACANRDKAEKNG